MTSWDVTAQALDHRDTVGALAAAMQAVTSDEHELAEITATNLAKVGLVLVPVTGGPLADVDQTLRNEAATSWFGREEDR